MKIFGTILPALLLAAVASAQEPGHGKLRGPKIVARSADDSDLTPFRQGPPIGKRSGILPIPNLFRRDTECPADAPNTCDTYYCAQNCCGDGNGNYCLYSEYCVAEGCCKLGKTCSGSGGSRGSAASQGPIVCAGAAGLFLAAVAAVF